MSYELSELGRQMANNARIGTISALDEANARVKVNTAGLTTDWLPWLAPRAGKTRVWSPPQLNEQVAIVSPFGDMTQAFVIGSLFSDDMPAPAASKDQETTVYPDGSTVDYNSATNTLTVTVSGAGNVIINCKVATVNADTSVQLNTPLTHCTGNLVVDGNTEVQGITSRGVNISNTHHHGGVQTGGGNTGAVNG